MISYDLFLHDITRQFHVIVFLLKYGMGGLTNYFLICVFLWAMFMSLEAKKRGPGAKKPVARCVGGCNKLRNEHRSRNIKELHDFSDIVNSPSGSSYEDYEFMNDIPPPALKSFPSSLTLNSWANKLDDKFFELTTGASDITGAVHIQNRYQMSFTGQIFRPNGTKILKDMKDKIVLTFKKNVKALNNLKNCAENAIRDSIYDPNVELFKTNYANVNRLSSELSNSLQYSSHYKQDVNVEHSGVHIPLEIYEGYPHILNEIQWSRRLEEVFLENRKNFPDIYYQLFGSEEGIMRIYPLSKWKTWGNLPDLYDVRRRPWYINGATSPKDIVVLMDTSGSMHGQSLNIMKIAAKTLINTFSEHDYVNVASFDKDVQWVTKCLNTLVQCNRRNKLLLFDGIDGLVPRYAANSTKAVEFAYKALEKFGSNQSNAERIMEIGSKCHKLILILSDGDLKYPLNIMKKWKNDTSDVRIFTYAIGSNFHKSVKSLVRMACETLGSFERIAHIGEIRTKIHGSYMNIISRPLVLSGQHPLKYSSIYQDAMGLGVMVTATLPVFNTSFKSNNQSLAGIVGVDIPLSKFALFAPKQHLGPLGYTFGLNTNGYVTYHPRFWLTPEKYLNDPANHDFNDIEGNSKDLIRLRRDMIDMAHTDNIVADIRMIELNISTVIHGNEAAPIDVDYYYTSINQANISIGIVIPKKQFYATIPYKGENLKDELQKLNNYSFDFAPWRYCDLSKPSDDTDTIESLKKSNHTCTGERVSHLLWDIDNAKYFEETSYNLSNRNIISKFLITDGGLILFKPNHTRNSYQGDPYLSPLYRSAFWSQTPIFFVKQYSNIPKQPKTKKQNIKKNKDFLSLSAEVHEKHPKSQCSLVQRLEDEKYGTSKSAKVHLAQSINIKNKEGDMYIAGVAGIEIIPEYVQSILFNLTFKSHTLDELSCSNSKALFCFLIDFSGNIITSNQMSKDVMPGDFLGKIDPILMKHLILDKALFEEHKEYNYADICKSRVDCSDDSIEIKKSELPGGCHRCSTKQSTWHLTKDIMSQNSFSIIDKLHSNYTSLSKIKKIHMPGHQKCSKEQSANKSQMIICENRQYFFQKLRSLNGIFIVIEPSKIELLDDLYKEWRGVPVEISKKDNCLLPTRYRKRPINCFKHDEREIQDCH